MVVLVGGDALGDVDEFRLLVVGRSVPSAEVALVEDFHYLVEQRVVRLILSCASHSRLVRVEHGGRVVERHRLVEHRAAQAVGVEVHLVEEVFEVIAPSHVHVQSGDEEAQIPEELFPLLHLKLQDGSHAAVHLDKLLALHLEVRLAVFGEFNLLVEAVARRVDERCPRLRLTPEKVEVAERVHLPLLEHAHRE